MEELRGTTISPPILSLGCIPEKKYRVSLIIAGRKLCDGVMEAIHKTGLANDGTWETAKNHLPKKLKPMDCKYSGQLSFQ